MIELTVDARLVKAKDGASILEAARAAGIEIPTLCYHEALGGVGACRLCVVEVSRKGGQGDVVASCVTPASPGLIVETGTARVREMRRLVLDLLLARAPRSPAIQELAAAHGLTESSFRPDEDRDNCILCTQCARVCVVVGAEAISAVGRGFDKEIASPFREPPETCIGCAACARICPTSNIYLAEKGGKRSIWKRDFELIPCEGCGSHTLTKEQAAHYAMKSGLEETYFALCDECQKKQAAKTYLDLMVDPVPTSG